MGGGTLLADHTPCGGPGQVQGLAGAVGEGQLEPAATSCPRLRKLTEQRHSGIEEGDVGTLHITGHCVGRAAVSTDLVSPALPL